MSISKVNQAIGQLLEVEEEKQEVSYAVYIFSFFASTNHVTLRKPFVLQGVITPSSLAVGMARLGQPTQKVCISTRLLSYCRLELAALRPMMTDPSSLC